MPLNSENVNVLKITGHIEILFEGKMFISRIHLKNRFYVKGECALDNSQYSGKFDFNATYIYITFLDEYTIFIIETITTSYF